MSARLSTSSAELCGIERSILQVRSDWEKVKSNASKPEKQTFLNTVTDKLRIKTYGYAYQEYKEQFTRIVSLLESLQKDIQQSLALNA